MKINNGFKLTVQIFPDGLFVVDSRTGYVFCRKLNIAVLKALWSDSPRRSRVAYKDSENDAVTQDQHSQFLPSASESTTSGDINE